MRRLSRIALAASALIASALIASAVPAVAHPRLVSASPAANAAVTRPTQITLTFSEALRTGEYAIGMDIAEAWETAWNADGTQMTLTVPADALNGQHTVNLIIFRLMDTDGNLIGGPVELHLDF